MLLKPQPATVISSATGDSSLHSSDSCLASTPQDILVAFKITKREGLRLLQPILDRVNSGVTQSRKVITFDAFTQTWERDYLSLHKPSFFSD